MFSPFKRCISDSSQKAQITEKTYMTLQLIKKAIDVLMELLWMFCNSFIPNPGAGALQQHVNLNQSHPSKQSPFYTLPQKFSSRNNSSLFGVRELLGGPGYRLTRKFNTITLWLIMGKYALAPFPTCFSSIGL